MKVKQLGMRHMLFALFLLNAVALLLVVVDAPIHRSNLSVFTNPIRSMLEESKNDPAILASWVPSILSLVDQMERYGRVAYEKQERANDWLLLVVVGDCFALGLLYVLARRRESQVTGDRA